MPLAALHQMPCFKGMLGYWELFKRAYFLSMDLIFLPIHRERAKIELIQKPILYLFHPMLPPLFV